MAKRLDPSLEYIAGLCRRNAVHVLKLAWTTHPRIGFDRAGVRWLNRYIEQNRGVLTPELTAEFTQFMGCFYGECLIAFIAGGLAPDVGLFLMTAGAAIVLPRTRDMSVREAVMYGFDELFFTSNWWIAAANVLHSPVVVAALFLASRAMSGLAGDRLRSFAKGAALHVAVDIAVHVDDGPVLFWPLNWSYRFSSRFSYYDPDHYGQWIAPVDIAITVIGGAFLLWKYVARRRATATSSRS